MVDLLQLVVTLTCMCTSISLAKSPSAFSKVGEQEGANRGVTIGCTRGFWVREGGRREERKEGGIDGGRRREREWKEQGMRRGGREERKRVR